MESWNPDAKRISQIPWDSPQQNVVDWIDEGHTFCEGVSREGDGATSGGRSAHGLGNPGRSRGRRRHGGLRVPGGWGALGRRSLPCRSVETENPNAGETSEMRDVR